MTIDVNIVLDDYDCRYLDHPLNTDTQRKMRAGDWYCCIKNAYYFDKCSKENKCNYYEEFAKVWLKG